MAEKGNIRNTKKKRILQKVKKGYTFKTACRLADISAKQAYAWMKKDEKFSLAYERAREARMDRLIEDILNADDWKARAWLLERCHSEDFGRHLLLKVSPSLAADYVARLEKAKTPEARLVIYEDAFNHGDLSQDGFNARVNALRVGNELLTEALLKEVKAITAQHQTEVKPYAKSKKDKS